MVLKILHYQAPTNLSKLFPCHLALCCLHSSLVSSLLSSLTQPNTFLSQGLCTCCSWCLKSLPSLWMASHFSSFISELTSHPYRKVFLHQCSKVDLLLFFGLIHTYYLDSSKVCNILFLCIFLLIKYTLYHFSTFFLRSSAVNYTFCGSSIPDCLVLHCCLLCQIWSYSSGVHILEGRKKEGREGGREGDR